MADIKDSAENPLEVLLSVGILQEFYFYYMTLMKAVKIELVYLRT